MTGAFIRIQRDGKWENVEIDQLTDEELEKFLTDTNSNKWAFFLAKWIRDNVHGEDPCPAGLAPPEERT